MLSLGSSAIALMVSLWVSRRNTKTKNFELSGSEHSKILIWFNDTIETLIFLRMKVEFGEKYEKSELAHLSALIEKGRYFFPNIPDPTNENGKIKPAAFSGRRQRILDTLVYSYNIFIRDDASKYVADLLILQKLFTSWVLEQLKPDDYMEALKALTGTGLSKSEGFEEFLENSQQYYENYANFKEIFMRHKGSDIFDSLSKKKRK